MPLPRIYLNPQEKDSKISPQIRLPDNYYELVHGLDKDKVMANVASDIEYMVGGLGNPVTFQWDEQRGLYLMELKKKLKGRLFLPEGKLEYQTEKINKPLGAAFLTIVGLRYLNEVFHAGHKEADLFEMPPRIFFNPELAYSNFSMFLPLPQDYAELLKNLDCEKTAEKLDETCLKIKKLFNYEAIFGWHNQPSEGVHYFCLHNGFESGAFTEGGSQSLEFNVHNVMNADHALALTSLALEYCHLLKEKQKK